MNKQDRINTGALKQTATLQVIEPEELVCHVCGSKRFFKIPIHDGESIRIDCAECEHVCHKHWYRKDKRFPEDCGYKFVIHLPCNVCRTTIGFTCWHGRYVIMRPVQADVPLPHEDWFLDRWWEDEPCST